ncbi:MAG: Integral membrane protein, partial [uncultured Pseudonocardia sp.]
EPQDLRLVLRGDRRVARHRVPLRRLGGAAPVRHPRRAGGVALLRQRRGQRDDPRADERVLAEDLPHHRHPDRRVRHAAGVPAADRGDHREPESGRGGDAGPGAPSRGRPHELRVPAQRGLPADRGVRRHVPVHAVPGLDVRGPRHQVAAAGREVPLPDRADRAHLGRPRRRRAGAARPAARRGPRRGAARRLAGPRHLPRRAGPGPVLRVRRPGADGGGRAGERLPQRVGRPDPAREGDRQGGLLPLPLPRGARRVVLLRRRHRRVRHHPRPDHHRAGPGLHRRDVRPVAHGLPGAQGHAGRVRLPRARRALGHRRARGHPADRHRAVPRRRDHHRPHRRRVHRCGAVLQHPPQPQARRAGHRHPQDRRPAGRRREGGEPPM